MTTLTSRMESPAVSLKGALPAMLELGKAVDRTKLDRRLRELVNIRASQINACGVCLTQHPKIARELGESDERLWSVAGWRDAPYFDDAERAALALTEAMTALGPEGVSDDVYDEAARHFDEPQLAGLILTIATINVWNRLNVATRQVAGLEW